MGAEVIKVERPTRGRRRAATIPYFKDGQSGYFLQQNMGKQGLCVNVKDPRGLELVHKTRRRRPTCSSKIIGRARSTNSGSATKSSSRRNPRLVYCSVSAYGHTGPDAARPGFGLIAEAKSGAMALIGVPGEPPPLFRMPIADMYAGIHGVAAVCAALLGRAKSGKGQHIDIALYDCMVSMHDYAVQCYTMSDGKEIPVQTGHDLPEHDGLRRVRGARRLPRDRGAGRRRVEAPCQADRRRQRSPPTRGSTRRRDAMHTAKQILAIVRAWTLAQPSRQAVHARRSTLPRSRARRCSASTR